MGFYWGWWISWGPFVGTFLAKISRGRTIRQFVLATLVVPSLYCFLWFGCVGGEVLKQQTLADGSGVCGAWLNGGGPATSAYCNLDDKELGNDGKCKNATGLQAAGLIDIAGGDEPNCGRRACSGSTLKKGLCGKMLPTCDHYSATLSVKQKQRLKKGYSPSCKLNQQGPQWLAGECMKFAWKHWEQKQDECVEITTWVDVPCGGNDPTALKAADLACKTGDPGNAPDRCQDKCKDKITKDMVDPDRADRLYNHFSAGSVESDAAKEQRIWERMTEKHSPDEDIEELEITNAAGNKEKYKMWVDVPGKSGKRLQSPPCFVPAPASQFCGWNQKTEDVLFDLIGSLVHDRAFADFIAVIALAALVIYFITSSDSGSLVVDIMAANGEEEPPIPQRIFWALTEGATAIALLYSGKNVKGPFGDPGEGGLRALQAASIIMGLPYTFMLFWYSQALVQVCREEGGELDVNRPRFAMFLIDIPRSGKVPVKQGIAVLLRNTFAPAFSPAVKVVTQSWPFGTITKGLMWQLVLLFLFLLSIVCCFLGLLEFGAFTMGVSCYFGFAGWVSLIRREIRTQWGIPRGDLITDFMWSVWAPMFVLTQLEVQMEQDKQECLN